jgi:chaperone BCS1
MKELIDHATDYQLQQMFLRFYPEQSLERAVQFSKSILALSENVSLAQVQGFFLFHKYDPQGVLDNANKITEV